MGRHRTLTWREGDPEPGTQATAHQRGIILRQHAEEKTIPQIAHALHLAPNAVRNVIRGRDPESVRLAAEKKTRDREIREVFADIGRTLRGEG